MYDYASYTSFCLNFTATKGQLFYGTRDTFSGLRVGVTLLRYGQVWGQNCRSGLVSLGRTRKGRSSFAQSCFTRGGKSSGGGHLTWVSILGCRTRTTPFRYTHQLGTTLGTVVKDGLSESSDRVRRLEPSSVFPGRRFIGAQGMLCPG